MWQSTKKLSWDFVKIREQQKKPSFDGFFTCSLVVLLTCRLLFRKANSSCLSDDSDLDLTWISHLCLDLFREIE